MTSTRTASERAQARARNLAYLEQNARQLAESPAAPIGQLWRNAGGGTPRFSQRAFSALLTCERWTATDRCASANCGTAPPHLCWWSAIRASVLELRHRRPAARPPADTTLTLFNPGEWGDAA